jgi:glycolate oxidase FAD binding subunit
LGSARPGHAERTVAPASPEEAAEELRAAAAGRLRVRMRGGGTKLSWGRRAEPADVELSTERLDTVVEHNEGDLIAVLQAGVPLARAQEVLGRADQMVALDPPLGEAAAATIGGVVATGDSGPLRQRYAAARDLVVGITVALPDGSLARAGGKVIKNVAGYDLAKLFTGSFGTLGLIVEVVIRLHPLPRQTVTVVGRSEDAGALAAAAASIAHSPFAPECLDVAWTGGRGAVMARFTGAAPEAAAGDAGTLMERARLETAIEGDDDACWDRQRAGQRSARGAVVRISGLASQLERVLGAAGDVGGSVVGRAGLGLSWVALGGSDAGELVSGIEELRRRLQPFACVVQDAPPAVRERLDVWGEDAALPLMRRVKERFDPEGVCNPGIFVGGI